MQDTLGVGIVQLDSHDWQVTATVDESDVQQTEECSLRVTDAAGLTADTSLFVSTRDSTNAQNEAPLNWPPFVQDVWFAVPADGHLTVDNSSLFDPPIEVEDPLPDDHFTGTQPKTFTVVTPPAHAQSFTFDTTNGSFTYVPDDGYSGADQFTVQVKDGLNQDTQIGTGNIYKITLYKPYLDVKTIEHNAPSGDLPQDQKVDYGGTVAQGAYLPIFDKNYDLTETSYVTLQPNTKTVLLPIVLKAFNPAPGGWAGFYTLGPTGNVKVFRDPAGKEPVGLFDTFWADQDTTLWVEGVSAGTENLGLSWSDLVHSAGDQSKMTVFTWSGPRNVPGTSTYTYQATGGLAGASSTWVDGGTASMLVGVNTEDPATHADTAKFKWDDRPVVGGAAYQAAPGYTWDMGVNVVRVEVLPFPGGNAFTINPGATPRDALFGNQIQPGSIPANQIVATSAGNGDGITYNADVFLTGPGGPHGPRGITQIQVGFIQTVTSVTLAGTYADNSTLTSDLGGRMPMNDAAGVHPPWYRDDPAATFVGQNSAGTNGVFFGNTYGRTITAGDHPSAGVPWTKQQQAIQQGSILLSKIDLVFQFTLEVSAITLDGTVAGEQIFTQMAAVDWKFDGSGTYAWPQGGNPTFALTGSGYSPGVGGNAWSTKDKGHQYAVPNSPNFTHELVNNQTFR